MRVCPACEATVPRRTLTCTCGHSFGEREILAATAERLPPPEQLGVYESLTRFSSPDDRHLWLRRAATLTRLLGFGSILLGALYTMLLLFADAPGVLGGVGKLAALGIIACATLCAAVGHFAFAQAIDAFVRISERADVSYAKDYSAEPSPPQ